MIGDYENVKAINIEISKNILSDGGDLFYEIQNRGKLHSDLSCNAMIQLFQCLTLFVLEFHCSEI